MAPWDIVVECVSVVALVSIAVFFIPETGGASWECYVEYSLEYCGGKHMRKYRISL